MPKQESTAINDLIHLVQGRIIDHSGDPQDNLFVTARAMPAPLPRRRAPNATPPMVPLHDYEDDETATSVDPQSLGADPRFALGSAPNPRPSHPDLAPAYAVPAYPQPILPHYAYPTPAPLPPAPYHADADATERVEQYDDVPPQEWHARAALPPRMARPTDPFEEHLDTVRVPALPRPRDLEVDDAAPSELVAMLRKCALPFAGLTIALMFVGGYVVHRGQGGHKRDVPVVPVVMAVTPSPAIAATVAPGPVVTPITISGAMVDEQVPLTTPWKPRDVQPTIAPAVEAIAAPVAALAVESAVAPPVAAPATAVVAVATPAADTEPAEIEMDATPVVKRRHHRASTTSSPVAARVVARSARPEPKPIAAATRGRKADPIAVAIAEPGKPAKSAAKGTGPGKVTITSTPAALIYIDGRSTNQMTPKTLTLAPGAHKITLLEISSRKAKTAEVDIAAGGTAQVAKKF